MLEKPICESATPKMQTTAAILTVFLKPLVFSHSCTAKALHAAVVKTAEMRIAK